MKKETLSIHKIPAILWGEKTDSIYLYVHGKMSSKEDAQRFAKIAIPRGYQVLSFDLPEHGDRKGENYPCVVWNCVHDLEIIGKYVCENWNDICLYGCSLGAYFSLLAYKDLPIRKCLFPSPVLDMERLIQNMMGRFNISEQELREKQRIPTPMGEALDWDYFCYVRDNPVQKWSVPTAILYGSEDNLTEHKVVEEFTQRFNCDLTVLDGSEHWFYSEWQLDFFDEWIIQHI